jgi:hypothetical protein
VSGRRMRVEGAKGRTFSVKVQPLLHS